jgi:hypothetical protein
MRDKTSKALDRGRHPASDAMVRRRHPHGSLGLQGRQVAVLSYSWKQKIYTKSFTETELIGVDNAISNILWSLYFMQEQGCGTIHAIIYQDIKNTILLESNRKLSSRKHNKHIKAKYFFVADKVDDRDIEVKHIPTTLMWEDMNTKTKLGSPYRIDFSHMMNFELEVGDNTSDGDECTEAQGRANKVHKDQKVTSKG